MYGTFTYIYQKTQINEGKYTIHGCYKVGLPVISGGYNMFDSKNRGSNPSEPFIRPFLGVI